jgi:hypothetical protein
MRPSGTRHGQRLEYFAPMMAAPGRSTVIPENFPHAKTTGSLVVVAGPPAKTGGAVTVTGKPEVMLSSVANFRVVATRKLRSRKKNSFEHKLLP